MGKGSRKKVVGTCRLCLNVDELKDSHIIPECFHEPIYDKHHRIIVLETNPGVRNVYIQKGIREKLLCGKCEQELCAYEQYASQLLYHKKLENVKFDESRKSYIFNGVDYRKFKLFQLSVLWRAGIAKHRYFKSVELGIPEKRIWEMLSNRDPGESHEYGCVVSGLYSKIGAPMNHIIIGPEKLRNLGHNGYRFIFGGYLWFFVVSSHFPAIKSNDLFIKKNGELHLPVKAAEDTELFPKLAQQLIKHGKVDF